MKCWLCDEDFEPEDLNEQGLCEDCQYDQENEQDYDMITDYDDNDEGSEEWKIQEIKNYILSRSHKRKQSNKG